MVALGRGPKLTAEKLSRQNMPNGPTHKHAYNSTRITTQELQNGTRVNSGRLASEDEFAVTQTRRWHASFEVDATYDKALNPRLTC